MGVSPHAKNIVGKEGIVARIDRETMMQSIIWGSGTNGEPGRLGFTVTEIDGGDFAIGLMQRESGGLWGFGDGARFSRKDLERLHERIEALLNR